MVNDRIEVSTDLQGTEEDIVLTLPWDAVECISAEVCQSLEREREDVSIFMTKEVAMQLAADLRKAVQKGT